MTNSARQSKQLFVLNGALAALSLVLLVATDRFDWTYWVRIAVTLLWAILTLLYFRSWRILQRRDDDVASRGA